MLSEDLTYSALTSWHFSHASCKMSENVRTVKDNNIKECKNIKNVVITSWIHMLAYISEVPGEEFVLCMGIYQ